MDSFNQSITSMSFNPYNSCLGKESRKKLKFDIIAKGDGGWDNGVSTTPEKGPHHSET